jgi:hypothetical protein
VSLVLTGTGIVEDQPFRCFTATHADVGERVSFIARDPTEILYLVLPDLTGIKSLRPQAVEAAE